MTKTIKGTVVWQDLEMGFFGIQTKSGKDYLPLNLPSKLQKNGISVHLKIEEKPDAMTMVMWGIPIQIIEVL